MNETDVIVIGGGAAGLIAAGTAAMYGKKVLLVEKNPRLARKVLITGKGRCNVTNNCDITQFISNVPKNPRFMYSALSQLSPTDTMEFFENLGLSLKTERGNRVFPASDKAVDVVDTLVNFIETYGVETVNGEVNALIMEDGRIKGIIYNQTEKRYAASVIVATGGLSYPLTGSTGDGYRFSKMAGHTVVPPKASLVPIETKEKWCRDLMGLSLKNVVLKVERADDNNIVFNELGEMLFTHFGVSGPLVLSASSHMREMDSCEYRLVIDLKPALSNEQLDARLLRDFSKYINKDFINSLGDLLPRKLIPVIVEQSGIPYEFKVNQLTKEMRMKLISLIKGLTMTVKQFRPIEEAIITSGGVDVSEINPKTMESKFVEGLFFAGEVIDVDAYTGGFNLQIAFSTGYVAGFHC